MNEMNARLLAHAPERGRDGRLAVMVDRRSGFGPGSVALFLGLAFAAAAPTALADSAKRPCEANLTCSRTTKAAVEHEFSSGPDLSAWQVTAVGTAAGPTRTSVPVPLPAGKEVADMELVLVPGACYDSGGEDGTGREVCIGPYYIGAFEVTFDEYDRFALATGRKLPDDEGWGRGRRPVINVGVYDALNYAKWLSRRTGDHYRLPTEVEWEHAARAGSSTTFPWGDELGSNRANCDGCGSQWDGEQTAPVGSFDPNVWGIHDVVGNVAEWTCSMRDPDPAHSFERCDSIYKTRRRAFRNGSWSDQPDRLGLAFRDWNAAMRRTDFVGFRLVRECKDCPSDRLEGKRDRMAQQIVE